MFHESHWDQVCRNDRTPMWFRDPGHVMERVAVLEVTPEQGNEDLLPPVLGALSETGFDPALLNGEPIVGELVLAFIFDPD